MDFTVVEAFTGGETIVLTNWAGATCTRGCVVAIGIDKVTGRGTGTGTGTDGGGTGLTTRGTETTLATGGAAAAGVSGAAATTGGETDTCLGSLPGLPKVPTGKKNPGGNPTDATVEPDAVAGWALPQPCSTEITV